jgi:hypothetical protein
MNSVFAEPVDFIGPDGVCAVADPPLNRRGDFIGKRDRTWASAPS